MIVLSSLTYSGSAWICFTWLRHAMKQRMMISIITSVVLCGNHKSNKEKKTTSFPSVDHEMIILQQKQSRFRVEAAVWYQGWRRGTDRVKTFAINTYFSKREVLNDANIYAVNNHIYDLSKINFLFSKYLTNNFFRHRNFYGFRSAGRDIWLNDFFCFFY